jgi:hypothetical protein
MSMIQKFLLPAVAVLMLSSCSDKRPELLQGRWDAILLVEESDTLQMDLSPVFLEMSSEGTYLFQSTLNYLESGRYRLEGNLLYIQDTTSTGSKERRIRIRQFEADTLILDMESEGLSRQLTLWRR